MPNDVDVREMTDRALDEDIRSMCSEIWSNGKNHPNHESFPYDICEYMGEIARRLSTLRAENERLKSEAVVMRELCEAYMHLCKGPTVNKQLEATRRLIAAGIAYRAMKGEKQAISLERLHPKVKLDPDYAKRLNDAPTSDPLFVD